MESQASLDPCVILDQSIDEIAAQMESIQLEIDSNLREWISLSLADIAAKRAGLRSRPAERKQLTVRRIECRTHARTLGCKKKDLSRRLQALLKLKDDLRDPDVAREIGELNELAQQFSACKD